MPRRSPLILAILFLSTLFFMIGTAFFVKEHYVHAQLKAALEADGIKTVGYVLEKDKQTNRRTSASDGKWQYTDDYVVQYYYIHDGQAKQGQWSLEQYLETENPPVASPQNLGRVELESTVGEQRFHQLQRGSVLPIAYLYGQPDSARIVDADGKVSVPSLQIFIWSTLFLSVLGCGVLFFYWKTGKVL